ncbi:uncharacterized protein LOC103579144 isoform X1 [Microplitis demolitor]|uniref:uncharacterized protein LOC103579144 isoform X1 n=2 Tax=Microplitis demolitor TaxID=69319 RepID=UPI0004CCB01B|nr:uncharacterized protein LOC103579144 isoform X1 [Microplitis demolitor]
MTEIVGDTDGYARQYCVTWTNYKHDIPYVVRQLLENESMVDVTLCVAGERIQAHRLVLSAFSGLLRDVLKDAYDDHPTIIISDVSAEIMKIIIEFCYTGQLSTPSINTKSLLDAAYFLQISALSEFPNIENSILLKEDVEEMTESLEMSNEAEDNNWEPDDGLENMVEAGDVVDTEDPDETTESNDKQEKSGKKKRKREYVKRDYNPAMLEAALNDVRNGFSLIDAANKNNVPRSTLYMRCKTLGLQLNTARHEYPPECLKAAINAVMNGASFQSASDTYNIPKTVLWRRIQKENYQSLRSDNKRSYDADKREAAVKALARGENLTKVALEFQIPKTTLFRDKTKLVDQGKLPESFWKKRKTEDEQIKKLRLDEAVAACLQGKMSQAAASVAYHIPKTTIWRRLQREQRKEDKKFITKRQNRSAQRVDKIETHKNSEMTLCDVNVSSEIPITYIDENNVAEESVIILTKEDVESLNLDDGQIVVSSDNDHEYVPCTISIEDTSSYSTTES